jgi:signal transduction histidine kinase
MRRMSMNAAQRHGWRGAAVAAWALAWLVVLASLVLAVVYRPDPHSLPYELHEGFYATDLIIAVVYGPVSALLLWRTRHPTGWVLAAAAVGFGIAAFGLMYGMVGAEEPDLPALGLVVGLVPWIWVVGAYGIVLVVPWVLLEQRVRGLPLAGALVGVAITVVTCATRAVVQLEGAPANPLALEGDAGRLAESLDGWSTVLGGAYGLVSVGYLGWRMWGAPRAERRGLGWVVAGLLLVLASYVVFQINVMEGGPLLSVAAGCLFAGQTLLPAALLTLVLRQRLWGVDVAVSRATMWGLLTAVVVAVYGLLVWAGSQVLPLQQQLSGAIAAAALALGVQPLRQWLQRRVDQLVYGTAHDPGLLLERLGTHLAGDAPGRSGLQRLVDGLRRNLRLGLVEVHSIVDGPEVQASAGELAGPPTRLPLMSQRGQVGWLQVGPVRGQRLDQRTLRLLESVAGVVAVALELAQVNAALEATRERLVDVRHAERRMLRRELHDGLGPALAGIGLGLAAVANLGPEDREQAQQLLVAMREELNRRTEDIRGMARTLLPPALDDGMLEMALHQLAARFTSTRLTVSVRAQGADALDPRRQIAVYHIVAEGVVNASRHADATRCDVQLVCTDGTVELCVQDDGQGLADDLQLGIGLRSMRERAEELGGTCEVRNRTLVAPGGDVEPGSAAGTEIVVRLP